jgi:hypothetical protein
MIPTWIPISADHLQKLLAWGNGQHHVESSGASIYTMSYVFSLFFDVGPFPIDQRATMGCPDSTLARPNSRISSTSLAMTRANHHSPNHVAAAQIVCYRIWDTSAIVRLILAFLFGHAGVADEFAAFFLILPCVVNSIVLLTNGISFAIQAVLLVMIGAWADYGTWRCAGAELSRGAE